MKRWDYIQTLVTISTSSLVAWVYVVVAWVGHMETGPYACPLKTPLSCNSQGFANSQNEGVVGPIMQGKSQVWG